MMAAVAVACAITIACRERIGVNGGQGWDGQSYVEWVADFWNKVVKIGLTRFHSQRVLPSLAVHYVLQVGGASATTAHVVVGFQLLNSVLLVAAAGLWAHLGLALRWPRSASWAGFVALFLSFANARHALYYPALTDVSAFALGMLMAWEFFLNHRWAIWLASLLGLITWPALPPVGYVLLVIGPRSGPAKELGVWQRILSAALALAAACMFARTALHYLAEPVRGVGDEKFADWVLRGVLPLTIVSLVAFLAIAWYVVLAQGACWDWRRALAGLTSWGTVIALVSVVALVIVKSEWIDAIGRRGEGPTWAQFKCEHTLAAIRGPMWGPVHHVVYFGPVVLLAALFWPRLAAAAAERGHGAILALCFVVAFCAGSNSRQWNHLFPFLVTLVIVATRDLWTPRRLGAFVAVSLLWSKIWLHIGYDQHRHWWSFPEQRYFMNHGPYASDTMYVVHLVAAAVTGVSLWLLFRDRSSD